MTKSFIKTQESFLENYHGICMEKDYNKYQCECPQNTRNYELSLVNYNLSLSDLFLENVSFKEILFYTSIFICVTIIFFNILIRFCCKDSKKEKLIKTLYEVNQKLKKENDRLNTEIRKRDFEIEKLENIIEVNNYKIKEKYEEINHFENLQEYSDIIDFIKYSIENHMKLFEKNINLILYTSIDKDGYKYIYKIDFGHLSAQIRNWVQHKTFTNSVKYKSQFYKELEFQKETSFLYGYIYKLEGKILIHNDIIPCLSKYKNHKIVCKDDKIIYESCQ